MKVEMENVVLLATSHNITKAYINRLNSKGLRPSQILLLNWKGRTYSNKIKGLSEEDYSAITGKIRENLKTKGLFSGELSLSTEAILKSIGWEYQNITIDHINDEKLTAFLSTSIDEDYIIFCGGGILRRQILNCGKKFIHVHPGMVPDVRGADGMLWSALIHDVIGMSVFFMDEGIDTGDYIDCRSFGIPQFEINFNRLDPQITKSFLVNYVDPHFRAETLASVFKNNTNPAQWETQKQCSSEGKTYYFMHEDLLPQAINKFYKSGMKMVS